LNGFPDNFQLLKYNWALDLGDIPEAKSYGIGYAIFFGFSAGLLGISGFETSANFVEEQKPGVFAKTLRNMWFIVSVYNPIIRSVCSSIGCRCVRSHPDVRTPGQCCSLMAISVLPLPKAMGLPLRDGRPNNDDLLIDMASTVCEPSPHPFGGCFVFALAK
jgi:hypothetical protein